MGAAVAVALAPTLRGISGHTCSREGAAVAGRAELGAEVQGSIGTPSTRPDRRRPLVSAVEATAFPCYIHGPLVLDIRRIDYYYVLARSRVRVTASRVIKLPL
ncbi:hypothetical protein MRX96_028543 [Rhipicephalus microplus]